MMSQNSYNGLLHLHRLSLDVFNGLLRCLSVAAPPVSRRDLEACASVWKTGASCMCLCVSLCGVCVNDWLHVYVCADVCVCVVCISMRVCICVCVRVPILPNTCQVKSAVWWAPREPCGPVHIHWLALHGGVGNIINQMRLCSVRVCASVCGVCVRVCISVWFVCVCVCV